MPRLFYFSLNRKNPETFVPGHFSQQRIFCPNYMLLKIWNPL